MERRSRLTSIALVVCAIIATLSLAFTAFQSRAQSLCAKATANAEAWIAVNVVARDFNRPVSLAENRAAVANIDRRLRQCAGKR